ncbi:MAG: amidohydrolase [Cytophagia bacterium]|nr:MAG: amidohydrolase [Cytophagia bacterium]TAG43292.1 MAG: amidohydrolase [Cytophagia bacterium]TAH29201.1 MAG: amidohydrolase [Cytophagales bacterium]
MKKKLLFIFVLITFITQNNIAQTKTNVTLLPKIEQIINKNAENWENRYKFLHQNPEISFQEKNTSALIAQELKKLGFEVTENFGGYGVIGVLKNGKGKNVLIRADTDALPLEEKTGLQYASKAKAKDDNGNEVSAMHACGHDMHITVFLGVAQTLAETKKDWKGTLIMVAQPAEERAGGAKAMIAEGLYQKFPMPDYAIALHCNATLQAGKIGLCEGYTFANVDSMDILVHGKGGHGAYPHTTIDPIVLGSQIILGLQTIVSREIAPTDAAVVTVGSIHGGTKHNIISDQLKMQLTIRSYKDEVRNHILKAIPHKCKHIALAAGMPENKIPEVTLQNESIPAVFNHIELTKKLKIVAENTLGKENVVNSEPVMGAEDFGLFGRTAEKIPICIFWLGTITKEKIDNSQKTGEGLPSLHSPFYAPEISITLKTGVKSMTSFALSLF